MRHSLSWILFTFALCFTFLLGCGANSGPAKPAASVSEIEQYAAEHPELNEEEAEEPEGE
jgi:hypothetical protein